jgi:hypothetical protein
MLAMNKPAMIRTLRSIGWIFFFMSFLLDHILTKDLLFVNGESYSIDPKCSL